MTMLPQEGSETYAPSAVPRRLFARNTLIAVYGLVTALSTVLKLRLGDVELNGIRYAPLQNYAIFRNSFFHLIHGQNLYARFPSEQWDFYKYSPTFALLMGPLAFLPYGAGALAWNLLNVMAVFIAVWAIPEQSDRTKAHILWFILLSLLVEIQNAQSNALLAGLMVGAWTSQEGRRPLVSSLCVALAAFIKPFGGIALLPCLLTGARWKLLVYTAMWSSLMLAIPLVVVSPGALVTLYQAWYGRLRADSTNHFGNSVFGLASVWFHRTIPAPYAIGIGTGIMVLVVWLRWDARRQFRFRGFVMAATLTWAVAFNYMAESPAMVLAAIGIALWYYVQPPTILNRALLAATFFLLCLAPNVEPGSLRGLLTAGSAAAIPVVLVWIKIQYDLLRFPHSS